MRCGEETKNIAKKENRRFRWMQREFFKGNLIVGAMVHPTSAAE
jgi:hypothetical protein